MPTVVRILQDVEKSISYLEHLDIRNAKVQICGIAED